MRKPLPRCLLIGARKNETFSINKKVPSAILSRGRYLFFSDFTPKSLRNRIQTCLDSAVAAAATTAAADSVHERT